MDDTAPLPRISEPAPEAIALSGDIAAEVVVVGGGITGLSAALHLAAKGCDVVLLEARAFGWGGSGRAYGQVVPYAKHDHSHILRRFGPARGPAIIDFLAAGPDLVFDLVARHGIRCDAQRKGLIFAAHAETTARRLQDQAAFWQERAAPVEYFGARRTADLIGSDYYPACLLDRRGGTLNSLAYTRGLAVAAITAGARLFAASPVVDCTRDNGGWRVRTPAGAVRAETLVLCMNAYVSGPFDRFWPTLRRSFIPMRAYQLVSGPLGPNLRRRILPGGQSLTDTRRLFSGIKLLPDGRLHFSADGPAFDPSGSPDVGAATRRVRAAFPQLDAVDWEENRTGWIAMTVDQYPKIHKLEGGVWCALGYSGRGIAFGTLLGRELARYVRRDPDDPPRYPKSPPRPIAGRALAPSVIKAMMAYYRFVDARQMAGYVNERWD